MNVSVLVGNVLDVPADVLIATANPWLQMTGGVNLAIILRPKGELVHAELQQYGPLTMDDFATALKQTLTHDWSPIELLKIVLKDEDAAEPVREMIG